MVEIKIDEKLAGGRLDKFLMKYFDKAPVSFIYKMLRKKNIVLNDKKADGKGILCAGDIIKIYMKDSSIDEFKSTRKGEGADKNTSKIIKSANSDDSLLAALFPDYIVYEDDNILAVNKPAGMLSQKYKEDDISLNDLVVKYLGKSDFFTPGISNRLDRNTGGIVLAGKNPAASRVLNKAFRNRLLSKHYYALVKGIVPPGADLNDLLIKDAKTNTALIVSPGSLKNHSAVPISTEFVRISANDNCSLTDVKLLTGRPHQIRAHLAFYGHPIIGDAKYGSYEINSLFRKKYGLCRQFLFAYKVVFNRMDGILEYLNGTRIEAQLPAQFLKILTEEGLWPPGKAGV